jgi:predicted nucleic-acid-binding protein
MRSVDTNVLVRLVVRDDPRQVAGAESFVSKGAWVSVLVLVEMVWVLEAAYGLSKEHIAKAIGMLLSHTELTVQDADVVEAALHNFRRRSKVSFTDCLVLEIAKKARHEPLGTFDRALSALSGAERLV